MLRLICVTGLVSTVQAAPVPGTARWTAVAQQLMISSSTVASISGRTGTQEQGAWLSTAPVKDAKYQAVLAAALQATVPCTVMGCMLADGMYPNVFFNDTLQRIDTTQFDVPWWFLSNITTSGAWPRTVLEFEGISYRADVWVNGTEIAAETDMRGAFRAFSLDVSATLTGVSQASASAGTAPLAVLVWRQHDRVFPLNNPDVDLGMSFIDWAADAPDGMMGLWKPVYVHEAGDVTVGWPGISIEIVMREGAPRVSALTPADVVAGADANVCVRVLTTNRAPISTTACISAMLLDPSGSVVASLSVNTSLHGFATEDVQLPCTRLTAPQWWWPWQMAATLDTVDAMAPQPLYSVNVSVGIVAGAACVPSDTWTSRFGVRTVNSTLTPSGARMFTVNGVPILIRGAGWAPDLFLRSPYNVTRAHLEYTRHMRLNAIRLEGKMETDDFFDISDELGLLAIPGWACCDAWQRWTLWTNVQHNVSVESMRSQALRLRSHPSVIAFLISSDELPPVAVERSYLDELSAVGWPNVVVSAASAANSSITGPTGVKMSGPYSFVPPSYWTLDNGTYNLGGGWGFLTEGGPGENPLTVATLSKYVPAQDLWPPQPDDCWGHCGNPQGLFYTIRRFLAPLSQRYWNATSLLEFSALAQLQVYESHRAMFDAYSRNKYVSTGLIQWMLNNAKPEGIWHLYDYDFTPAAAYFAARDACEPVHIAYGYDDATPFLVNSLYTTLDSLNITAAVYAPNGTLLWQRAQQYAAPSPDGVLRLSALTVPSTAAWLQRLGPNATYLLHLLATNATEPSIVSESWYWLSTAEDVLDWSASTFYNTPFLAYANFSALAALPAVTNLIVSGVRVGNTTTVTLANQGTSIAFFVAMRVVSTATGDAIAPAFWSQNMLTLLPGASRSASVVANTSEGISIAWTCFNNRQQSEHVVPVA